MKRVCILVCALLFLPILGCTSQTAYYSSVGFCCDTVVTVSAYADSQQVVDDALAVCARYEQLLSKEIAGSDVWNINHANGDPVVVSDAAIQVLTIAQEVYQLSDGAFDITIASASELWDFRSDTPQVPNADALLNACLHIDAFKIEVQGNTVTLPVDMRIDLGGVAKGYIADQVKAYLLAQGVKSACINMGGNVVTIGTKPDGADWQVGVRDPNGTAADSCKVVSVHDMAVVTSGDYERYFEVDGVRYHHILDPKTGMPVMGEVRSVTILCADSAVADALSTAIFVMQGEAVEPLLRSFSAQCILVYRDGTVQEIT